MNIKKIFLAALCISLCASFGVACSQEHMSRVTVFFGKNPMVSSAKKEGLFERILSRFYTNAFAKGVWNETHDSILLTITGDNMDSVSAVIPPSTSSYTVEVPMGDSRVFTMTAYNGAEKKWGGHVLANLNKENESVQMNVFPIVTGLWIAPSAGNCTLYWDEVMGVTGYNVYRSTSASGPYVKIQTVTVMNANDTGIGTYYYRISVIYPQGEGEMCDYQSATM